jgi:hypothetical protein
MICTRTATARYFVGVDILTAFIIRRLIINPQKAWQ